MRHAVDGDNSVAFDAKIKFRRVVAMLQQRAERFKFCNAENKFAFSLLVSADQRPPLHSAVGWVCATFQRCCRCVDGKSHARRGEGIVVGLRQLVDKSYLRRVEDGKGCCGHGELP